MSDEPLRWTGEDVDRANIDFRLVDLYTLIFEEMPDLHPRAMDYVRIGYQLGYKHAEEQTKLDFNDWLAERAKAIQETPEPPSKGRWHLFGS